MRHVLQIGWAFLRELPAIQQNSPFWSVDTRGADPGAHREPSNPNSLGKDAALRRGWQLECEQARWRMGGQLACPGLFLLFLIFFYSLAFQIGKWYQLTITDEK